MLSQRSTAASTDGMTLSIVNNEETTSSLGGTAPMSKSMVKGVILTLVVAVAYQNAFLSSVLPSWNQLGRVAAYTMAFLALVVGFVNYYIGKDLRKCSPLMENLAYVNEETQSSQCIKDLDKVANPEGISKMWKELIQDKNVPCKILLTGVTGYVGRAFLFQLLREIAQAEKDGKVVDHKVYVMARPKARKNLTAEQRLNKMRSEPIFSKVQEQYSRVVVAAESGDLQEDKCGMSDETLQMLNDANLTHVVHCAADVNFNRPLADSAGINISPALQLQALASKWPTCKRFVHCSTAFVNPGCGAPDNPMREALFPLGKYDPHELYDSMRGDQKLALEAKAELQFPNNYVFTKCVAEHLVTRKSKVDELKIVRPAIVGPAWVLPEPGWNGDKPSTITALFLLWGTRVIRFAPLNTKPTAMIPVDVVAVCILEAMIAPSKTTGEKLSVRNLTWSHNSPIKFVDGISMAKQSIPVGVLKHHFTATEAAVSFALTDLASNYPILFNPLHRVFNLGPLKLLQFVCWLARISGIKSILDQLPVTKLLNFSDMLTLYRPYLARPYFFESSIDVPPSLNSNQYCISLFTATHDFWTKLFPGTIENIHELVLMPKGRFDLWWALTLPCGTFTNRLIGYVTCKIIRATYGSSEVNFETLYHTGRTLMKLENTMAEQKHCVVLAPTHRSLMDYILAKYIAFSMVGLGIDVPTVFADAEFDEPDIRRTIGKIKQKFDRHATLAAFLEGSPSPDGRLQEPKTRFLKALVESPGDHDYTLIPLCIDYDRVDNDNTVMKEATKNSNDLGLLDLVKLYWQICVSDKSQQSFGDVRIQFGEPISLEAGSDLKAVVGHVQNEHRRLTTVSEYQIEAANRHLKIPANTLRKAMEDVNADVCANKTDDKANGKAEKKIAMLTPKEFWRLHMQWLPRLAPYLKESHPVWADWIMSTTAADMVNVAPKTDAVEAVLKILRTHLDTVDSLAKEAAKKKTILAEVVKEMSVVDKNNGSCAPLFEPAASFVL